MQAQPLKKSSALQTEVVIPRCWLARDFFSRFLGLMGRTDLPREEAVLFPKCNSIHTFFMRFPIDVAFVSKDGTVVEVVEGLTPWRMLAPRWSAAHVIETRSGLCRELGITTGAKLECEGVLR